MANTIFINIEDVKKRSPMGGNVDTDKYVQSIYHVQRTQLLPIIGEDLYQEIKTAVDASPGTAIPVLIQTLLDGPMKDLIVNYTVADFTLTGNYNITNGGINTYSPDNGFSSSTDEVIRATERLEDKAKFYGQELITFLNDNQSDYPSWVGSTTSSNFFGWVNDDLGTCDDWFL